MRKKRESLSAQEVSGLSRKIEDRFWSLEAVLKACQFFTYVSFRNEPDTFSLIRRGFKEKKRILVPAVVQGQMGSCPLNSESELVLGAFGIPEPARRIFEEPQKECVFLIPGLVFDRKGNRMGYGKGFYDRFLTNRKNLKIALAYSFQILPQIEVKNHDVPVDIIITEDEIILCGAGNEF